MPALDRLVLQERFRNLFELRAMPAQDLFRQDVLLIDDLAHLDVNPLRRGLAVIL